MNNENNVTDPPTGLRTQRLSFDAPTLDEKFQARSEPEEQDEDEVIENISELPDPVMGVAQSEPAPQNVLTSLDDLSVDELTQLEQEASRKRQEKQMAEKQAVIDQIVNVVSTYGITTEELVEALGGYKVKRKGVKAQIKFRDPVTGNTWSGRGKTPTWMQNRDPEEFRIEAEAA